MLFIHACLIAYDWPVLQVEFTTTKKSAERRHEVGLITLKTHKESRPYTVKAVVDAKTDEHLSVDAAIARGILDQGNGVYNNPTDGSEMSLADALDSGLLIVEFDSEAEVTEPEVCTSRIQYCDKILVALIWYFSSAPGHGVWGGVRGGGWGWGWGWVGNRVSK